MMCNSLHCTWPRCAYRRAGELTPVVAGSSVSAIFVKLADAAGIHDRDRTRVSSTPLLFATLIRSHWSPAQLSTNQPLRYKPLAQSAGLVRFTALVLLLLRVHRQIMCDELSRPEQPQTRPVVATEEMATSIFSAVVSLVGSFALICLYHRLWRIQEGARGLRPPPPMFECL